MGLGRTSHPPGVPRSGLGHFKASQHTKAASFALWLCRSKPGGREDTSQSSVMRDIPTPLSPLLLAVLSTVQHCRFLPVHTAVGCTHT